MDREKVIRGLECAIDPDHNGFKNCHSCAYRKDIDHLQYVCDGDRCIADALALLKAQEPVEPKTESSGSGVTWWYVCGACLTAINPNDKFCHVCGMPVKWDG